MAYLNREDKFLVIIGPSGAGKSAVIHKLDDQGLIVVTPSWTTRPPRADEKSGTLEHHFVSETEFMRKKSKGYFLEALQMFNLPYWYGLPKIKKSKVGIIPVIMLRANLLPLLKKYYTNYVVYQIEDEISKIKSRLLKREVEGQELGTRLDDYQKEVKKGRKVAQKTFTNSDSLNLLTEKIKKALFEDFKEFT